MIGVCSGISACTLQPAHLIGIEAQSRLKAGTVTRPPDMEESRHTRSCTKEAHPSLQRAAPAASYERQNAEQTGRRTEHPHLHLGSGSSAVVMVSTLYGDLEGRWCGLVIDPAIILPATP